MKTTRETDDFLRAALVGYEQQRQEIDAKIAVLRKQLGARTTHGNVTTLPKKHRISVEGRARIAAAQRKRWAAAKKAS